MNPLGLQDKWVVVTGATRGIGRVTAEALAAAGARVVVSARDAADCEEVADALTAAHGTRAAGIACDVADADAVTRLFRDVRDVTGGALHGLVNNAGYPLVPEWWKTPVHAVPLDAQRERWRKVWEVDVQGARFCTHEALQLMMPRGAGSIVFTSSTPPLVGHTGTPYTEAKGAVLGLMRDVARAVGPKGVRVNAIAPGNIATWWADTLTEEEREAAAEEAPLRRWGTAEEVAHVTLFLLSDLASFVTGQTLVVDGGTVMR